MTPAIVGSLAPTGVPSHVTPPFARATRLPLDNDNQGVILGIDNKGVN